MLVVLRTASCHRWFCCTCIVAFNTGYICYDLLTVTPFFVLNPRNYLPFTSIVKTDCSHVCIFCFVFWYMCLCVRVRVLIRMSSEGWRNGKEKLWRSHCRILKQELFLFFIVLSVSGGPLLLLFLLSKLTAVVYAFSVLSLCVCVCVCVCARACSDQNELKRLEEWKRETVQITLTL